MIKKYKSQRNENISSKLKSYSALTGAFLLSAGATQGQVVFTDIDPDTIIHNNNFDIDFDNDGIKDFVIHHSTSSYYGMDRRVELRPGVDPTNRPMAGLTDFMFFDLYAPLNLPAGNPIGPGGPFYSLGSFGLGQMLAKKWLQQGMGQNFYWTSRGPFMDSAGYIGVEFHANNNTYYGWIQCYVDTGCHGVLIKGYAYDATPNHYIIAGSNNTTGISDLESLINPTESFYPNPVTNGKTFIRIDAKLAADLKLEVMNGMGQILLTDDRKLSSGKNVVDLDVSALKNGTYFVKLSQGKEIYFRKILVSN